MSYFHWLGRDADKYDRRYTQYSPWDFGDLACRAPINATYPPIDSKTREAAILRALRGFPIPSA